MMLQQNAMDFLSSQIFLLLLASPWSDSIVQSSLECVRWPNSSFHGVSSSFLLVWSKVCAKVQARVYTLLVLH